MNKDSKLTSKDETITRIPRTLLILRNGLNKRIVLMALPALAPKNILYSLKIINLIKLINYPVITTIKSSLFQLFFRYEPFPKIKPIAISLITNSARNIIVIIFPKIKLGPEIYSFPFF